MAVSKLAFHFYSLNLEKAIAQIVAKSPILSQILEDDKDDSFDVDPNVVLQDVDYLTIDEDNMKKRKRQSSASSDFPLNTAIINKLNGTNKNGPSAPSRKVMISISQGTGTLGRNVTWDEFPNGRFGDSRSPAYGEIDGYGPSLKVSNKKASLRFMGTPCLVG